MTAKVPYLKGLGVDAVWLSPFYPSALKDGGCEYPPLSSRESQHHTLPLPCTSLGCLALTRTSLTSDDVADYRDVDPRIGTLEDFDEMMAKLKAAGIKVMVDIVPNHSSDEHVWFQEALKAGRGSAARERYIFREGESTLRVTTDDRQWPRWLPSSL